MNHSATDPYYPDNLDDFAPWVAKHGLREPYGKCQCGCGKDAPVIAKSNYAAGRKAGHPARFVHGHNARIWDSAPPGYKTCHVCGEVKRETDFLLLGRGGLSVSCKSCRNEASRRHYHANRDERLERYAIYRNENKAVLNQKMRERRADLEYRKRQAERLKDWRDRNQDRIRAYNRSNQVRARAAVNHAIRGGKLPPPSSMMCRGCEARLASHYHHHSGYEEAHWFDVVALCTECHGREHWSD